MGDALGISDLHVRDGGNRVKMSKNLQEGQRIHCGKFFCVLLMTSVLLPFSIIILHFSGLMGISYQMLANSSGCICYL